MICQVCGVEAPTKYVAFYQNIGALIIRFQKSIKGNLCKSCINNSFWSFTLTDLTLGWWGIISLIVTPFFILNNVIRYLLCLGLEPAPVGATAPKLTDDAVFKLNPYANEIINRLNGGEKLDQIAPSISARAGVTPGQLLLYVSALAQAAGK